MSLIQRLQEKLALDSYQSVHSSVYLSSRLYLPPSQLSGVWYSLFYSQRMPVFVSLSLCQSVLPSVCLSVCLSICLSVSVGLSISQSVSPSFHLSVCLSVRLSVCLFVCRSVRLSIRLSVCQSVYLSTRQSRNSHTLGLLNFLSAKLLFKCISFVLFTCIPLQLTWSVSQSEMSCEFPDEFKSDPGLREDCPSTFDPVPTDRWSKSRWPLAASSSGGTSIAASL